MSNNHVERAYRIALHYSNLLGIPTPNVCFVPKLSGHAIGQWDKDEYQIQLVAQPSHDLNRTIAHELIHAAGWMHGLDGERFDAKVDSLQQNHLFFRGRLISAYHATGDARLGYRYRVTKRPVAIIDIKPPKRDSTPSQT